MTEKAKHGSDDTLTDAFIFSGQPLCHLTHASTKVSRGLFAITVFVAPTLGHLVIEEGPVGQAEVEGTDVCDSHSKPLQPKGAIDGSCVTMH